LSQLSEKIAAEIRLQGAIPFLRFMELALYCPVYGYYEKEEDTIGRRGDFFTNVSVGSVFGELLAGRFAEWMEASPNSKVPSPKSNAQDRIEALRFDGSRAENQPLQIVEAGAHRGALALDILKWMRQRRPALFGRLEYWIVEPSPRRQTWQRETLSEFAAQVRWAGSFQGLRGSQAASSEVSGVRGVIFCNELLDAMPVRRFGWDASRRCWFEWGVALEGERFVWARMPATEAAEHEPALNALGTSLVEVLPDGFTVETCPAAIDWWRRAAECLVEGKLLAIDYGLTDEELFLPERPGGTLRAYRGHRLSPDVLADPGEQDITAHVDFGAMQRAGELAGLITEGLFAQAQFLTPPVETDIAAWIPQRIRQFRTLTHPEHLGRVFRVLIQSRVGAVNS
jgi:SAM-dependent MidA family methyltransferase